VAPVVTLEGGGGRHCSQEVPSRVGLVAHLHDQLVGAGHQREAVGVVERLRDVLAEGVAGPPGGDAPAAAVVGVGPQQVTHGTLKRRKRSGHVYQ